MTNLGLPWSDSTSKHVELHNAILFSCHSRDGISTSGASSKAHLRKPRESFKESDLKGTTLLQNCYCHSPQIGFCDMEAPKLECPAHDQPFEQSSVAGDSLGVPVNLSQGGVRLQDFFLAPFETLLLCILGVFSSLETIL
jgi:hypothetical protein